LSHTGEFSLVKDSVFFPPPYMSLFFAKFRVYLFPGSPIAADDSEKLSLPSCLKVLEKGMAFSSFPRCFVSPRMILRLYLGTALRKELRTGLMSPTLLRSFSLLPHLVRFFSLLPLIIAFCTPFAYVYRPSLESQPNLFCFFLFPSQDSALSSRRAFSFIGLLSPRLVAPSLGRDEVNSPFHAIAPSHGKQ